MIRRSGMAVAVVLLAGCATIPSGPSVTALPGSGKSFEEFRADDRTCRHYGEEQVSGATPARAQDEAVAKSAVAGAVLGGVAGAAIDGGDGAAIGAGAGVLIGSVAGIDAGYRSAHSISVRYDAAYVQCMYAKGNRVPVSGQMVSPRPPNYAPPPPGRAYPPPPDFYPVPPSYR